MSKGVSDISGLRNIKSMQTTDRRSRPRVASSAHLDLYMLGKEKERLENEDVLIDKRKAGIQKKLDDIRKEMEVLEGLCRQEKAQQACNKEIANEESQGKKWKKLALSY